jgi:hypothetical protein
MGLALGVNMDPLTTYEALRLLLSAVQVIATIGAPFMVIWLDRRIQRNRRDDDK